MKRKERIERAQFLLQEVIKAQSNNQNQDGYRMELKKLGFDYNPFKKTLRDLNLIIRFTSINENDSIWELKKEKFLKKESISFFGWKKLHMIQLAYDERHWVWWNYAFQDHESEKYWIVIWKNLSDIKKKLKYHFLEKKFKEKKNKVENIEIKII